MADRAILSIHDTGVCHGKFFKDRHRAVIESDTGEETGRWIDAEQYQSAVTERRFVSFVLTPHRRRQLPVSGPFQRKPQRPLRLGIILHIENRRLTRCSSNLLLLKGTPAI